jgi:hypothetical protein
MYKCEACGANSAQRIICDDCLELEAAGRMFRYRSGVRCQSLVQQASSNFITFITVPGVQETPVQISSIQMRKDIDRDPIIFF